ncbi:MAG: DUF348 domain-containing protein [Clostridiales bacterium]|nr:DUF348 domain-containing protein [Clostridiales bacterium]
MESEEENMLRSKLIWFVCIVLVIAGGISATFAHYIDKAYHEVTLNDNGYIVQIQTMDKTVEELLDKYEITLGPGDEIRPDLEEAIEEDTEIEIKRAFKVTIEADSRIKSVYVTEGTVKDALDKAYIVLGEKDFTNHDLTRQAAPGDHIKVTRVKEEVLVETETIPYRIITQNNSKLNKGVEKVVQEGKEGKKERKILIAYHDGREVNRELVEEKVAQEPTNRIIDRGTYVAPPVSRGSTTRDKEVSKSNQNKSTSQKSSNSNNTSSKEASSQPANGVKGKTFEATAYTHTGNKTRTGIWPKKGIVAVDPKVIPLYTKIYIEFPKGWTHLNGYYQAMDTGGAIKGNIVDVFVDDKATARKFGRRTVKVSY